MTRVHLAAYRRSPLTPRRARAPLIEKGREHFLFWSVSAPSPALILLGRRCSEMDERSKCDPQIVVRAAVKIHFIRDIEAQAHRTKPALESAPGTEHPAQV